jgi:hypothetical protein
VATGALNSEIELLHSVGLLPRDLGTVRVQTTGQIPTGTELQALYDGISVTDDELVSEAERAWKYGDYGDQVS